MEEVLKAIKTLGEYCNHMHCDKCILKSQSVGGSTTCLYRQTSPWSIGAKVKVETREVHIWEGK